MTTEKPLRMLRCAVAINRSQHDALKWLVAHGGDGMFDRNGVFLAAGESAPVMRATWNKLRGMGLVEFYGNKRMRLVPGTEVSA